MFSYPRGLVGVGLKFGVGIQGRSSLWSWWATGAPASLAAPCRRHASAVGCFEPLLCFQGCHLLPACPGFPDCNPRNSHWSREPRLPPCVRDLGAGRCDMSAAWATGCVRPLPVDLLPPHAFVFPFSLYPFRTPEGTESWGGCRTVSTRPPDPSQAVVRTSPRVAHRWPAAPCGRSGAWTSPVSRRPEPACRPACHPSRTRG